MTVYVDDMRAPFRRMIMCHMIATSEDELHAMTARIGVARRWYQGDHYDIALSKRARAVDAGALEITWRQLGCMVAYHKRMGVWVLPEDAILLIRRAFRIRMPAVAGAPEGKVPFHARCGEPGCGHIWVAAYAPMNLAKFAEVLKGIRCPLCASHKAMVANQSDGALLEMETSP